MQYTDKHYHLRVEFDTKECSIPPDELTRMEESLEPLGDAIRDDFPTADLHVRVLRHPNSDRFHVEARLRLPGRTLFTGDWDRYLDTAYQRCLRKLVRKVEDYKEHPDRRANELADQLGDLEREVVAPEGTDMGVVGQAARAGDYRTFRNALLRYEDWLRKRVGRWVQRYPEAQARVGQDLLIGDLVEEVYLNAFEHFPEWPTEVPFHEWLDGLINPSLQWTLRHPDDVHENASMARTWRELPVGQK